VPPTNTESECLDIRAVAPSSNCLDICDSEVSSCQAAKECLILNYTDASCTDSYKSQPCSDFPAADKFNPYFACRYQ
jgi:hypothetical protein